MGGEGGGDWGSYNQKFMVCYEYNDVQVNL